MAKENKAFLNEEGINGTGEGIINVNSKDFMGLREAIRIHAENQTKEQKIKYGLTSLRYQMESFISEPSPEKAISAGEFLKRHLALIGVKNKDFANYIDLEESNLSSIIKSRRKINVDLALKLGQIFRLNPDLWLLVQSKNELIGIDESKKAEYHRFRLDELLKKAS